MFAETRRILFVLMTVFASDPLFAQAPIIQDPDLVVRISGYLDFIPDPMCTPNIETKGRMFGTGNVYFPISSIADMEYMYSNITFQARGCTGSDINHMWVRFTASNLDVDGRLIPKDNISNDDAPFRFELHDTDSNNRIIIGKLNPSINERGTSAAFSDSHWVSSKRLATKTYQVRYYIPQGAPPINPGRYVAPVTAHFEYH